LLPIALFAAGAGCCALLVPAEAAAVKQQLFGFPDSDVASHQLRPLIVQALCFLPAFASLLYVMGGTLDRYITRQFAEIFGICLTSLFVIFLLIDLTNQVPFFSDSPNKLRDLTLFYQARIPGFLLMLLPYSLLLALLYSLGKLSGSREIIAMIQAGRSVVRITLPLIFIGLILSLFCLGLNYQWAPTADAKALEFRAESKGETLMEATNVLYRNPVDRRLWEVGGFPRDYQFGKPLRNLEVTTTRSDGTLETRLYAKQATWNSPDQSWTFLEPVIGEFARDQAPLFHTIAENSLTIHGWSETPWQLIKPGLPASQLGVPDLTSWLKSKAPQGQFAIASPYLTQWHYRWALPFSCLVTVLLATPLGIYFSRHGASGGIFLAIVLSALMLLMSNVSLALGESGILRPMLAAWVSNIFFAIVGLYLFYRRISGRPIYYFLRQLVPGNE